MKRNLVTYVDDARKEEQLSLILSTISFPTVIGRDVMSGTRVNWARACHSFSNNIKPKPKKRGLLLSLFIIIIIIIITLLLFMYQSQKYSAQWKTKQGIVQYSILLLVVENKEIIIMILSKNGGRSISISWQSVHQFTSRMFGFTRTTRSPSKGVQEEDFEVCCCVSLSLLSLLTSSCNSFTE